MNSEKYAKTSIKLKNHSPSWIVLFTLLLIAFTGEAMSYSGDVSSSMSESRPSKTDSIPCLQDRTIQAIIDSALLYEAVKPIVRELRVINTLQNRENEALRNQIRFQDIQATAERKERQTELRKAKREAFWTGFKWGAGTGGTAAFIVILFTSTITTK